MAEETLTDPTTGGETGGGATEPTAPETPETPKPEDKVVSISVAESMFTQFGEALPGYIQGNMDQIDSNRLIPAGGTQGQTLVKTSDTDYDTSWATVDARPAAIYTTFDAGSGEFPTTSGSMVTIEQTPNVPIVLPDEEPTRKGYTFDGWFLNTVDGLIEITSETIVDWPVSNLVSAKWTAVVYNVTLSANHSGGTDSYTTASYDQNMIAVTVPVRDGYTFTGYYDNAISGTMYYNQNGDSVKAWDIASDAILYAHWKKNVTSGDQLSNYTWDELGILTNNAATNPEDYTYMLGQTVDVSLTGFGTVSFQLIGIGHDNLADGSGKAGFTFQCKLPLTTRVMGTGATWEASDIRNWLNTTVLEAMPADLKKNIKPVKKKYNESGTIKECSDSLYLISWSELTGSTAYGAEGTMYQYWAEHSSESDRIKGNSWWTRTYSGSNVVYINETGSNATSVPMATRGVSFCFSIGGDETSKLISNINSAWASTTSDASKVLAALHAASDNARKYPAEYKNLIGKKLTINHSVLGNQEIRLIGIAHDDKADGTGKAGWTFDFVNILENRYMHKDPNNLDRITHYSGRGSNGTTNVFNSDLYTYLNGDFLNGFPDNIKSLIVSVSKKYNWEGSVNWENVLTTHADKIWLLSACELTKTAVATQTMGYLYSYYRTNSMMKSTTNDWYLRDIAFQAYTNYGSGRSFATTVVVRKDKKLYSDSETWNAVRGISPAFCID